MRRMLARRSGVAIGLRERALRSKSARRLSLRRRLDTDSMRRAHAEEKCVLRDAVVALLVLVLVLVVLLVVGDDDEGVVVDFKDDARDRDRLRGNHTHATNVYAERDLQIAPGIGAS